MLDFEAFVGHDLPAVEFTEELVYRVPAHRRFEPADLLETRFPVGFERAADVVFVCEVF